MYFKIIHAMYMQALFMPVLYRQRQTGEKTNAGELQYSTCCYFPANDLRISKMENKWSTIKPQEWHVRWTHVVMNNLIGSGEAPEEGKGKGRVTHEPKVMRGNEMRPSD